MVEELNDRLVMLRDHLELGKLIADNALEMIADNAPLKSIVEEMGEDLLNMFEVLDEFIAASNENVILSDEVPPFDPDPTTLPQ